MPSLKGKLARDYDDNGSDGDNDGDSNGDDNYNDDNDNYMRRRSEVGDLSPCWALVHFIFGQIFQQAIVFTESNNSSVWVEVHDYLTTNKVAIAMLKHCNTSISPSQQAGF